MFGQSGLNFGTVFGQFGLKFQECSRTSRIEFSEMFREFLDSLESPLSQKFAKTDGFYGAFNVYGHFGQFHIILSMSLSNWIST